MISQDQARSALHHLGEARDMALIFGTGGGKFSQEELLRQFGRAAEALGFTLTPTEGTSATDGTQEAYHVTALARIDPDSGRPSLVEPAAPSELSHNFGG